MAIDVLEKEEVKNRIDEQIYDNNNQEKERKIRRIMIFILLLIILLLLFICYKMGNIGFNSIEAYVVDKIELTGENLEISNNTKLNIFSGLQNGKIAPNSSGTYRFSVKNKSDYDMIYSILFEDDMKNFVNMKYRLKIDNIYVKGDSNTYVSIDELNLESIIVPRNSINIYTLEWKWEDSDENDTRIATMEENQYYFFRMQIISNIYKK